jgi:hypothetical protein
MAMVGVARRRPGPNVDRARFVVLSAGWSGATTLAHVLGRSGMARLAGSCLGRPVADPAGHLRRQLDAGGRWSGAVVEPDHLWLVNGVDPRRFIDDLLADGIHVLVLERRSTTDRGLSRALCGPGPEVLPTHPVAVDPGAVAVYARHAAQAGEWFDACVPSAPRLEFETDVAGTAEGAVDRFASLLDIPPWTVRPSPFTPTSERLWALTANADEVRSTVDALASVGR